MKNISIKIIALFTYVAMVVTNYMATSLPLNNRSTGEISDAYPNLFAPDGPAFSIWGLIYLLLGIYVIYQFINKDQRVDNIIRKINIIFIINALANISWIFAWHYDFIGLSVILMAILLTTLIYIADILRKEQFNSIEKFIIRAPFSIYFGWITVATIANITVFLVSIGWNGFGIADYVWMSIVLLVGAVIGILRMWKDKNAIYGLVLVWAYSWILFKHISVDGFGGQYINIIATIIFCLSLFIFFIGKILFENK